MPREILNKLSTDVHNVFGELILQENFRVPNREKENPYWELMQIQNMAIAIQSRNVILKDDVEKLIKINQLWQQEMGLRTRAQTQLLECGRYLQQGSLEHYVGDIWRRELIKTGALYNAPTQFAIITALLELVKKFG